MLSKGIRVERGTSLVHTAKQGGRWWLGIRLPLLAVGSALAVNLILHRPFDTYALLILFMFAVSITTALGGRTGSETYCRRSFCSLGALLPG